MSISELIKLKSGGKNGTKITLNFLSNLIGDSNDETNFSRTLYLTDTQVLRLLKAFKNESSINIKFSKTRLSQMIQSGGILADLIAAISQVVFHTRVIVLKRKMKMV